ncbi:MAG: PKD domain-containing protein [Ignavibacteriaceae bacterium]
MKGLYRIVFSVILTLTFNIILFPQTGGFLLTDPLNEARQFENSPVVLLKDGNVFVSGGIPGSGGSGAGDASNSAEVYDILSEAWQLVGSMQYERVEHQATLLDNGMVLVTGGHSSSYSGPTYYSSAEIYDPNSRSFTLLTSQMSIQRTRHQALKLNDGKILIMGGHNSTDQNHFSAELFDPITSTFSPISKMNAARSGFSATLLYNGKVLIVGGNTTGVDVELFDPTSQTFIPSGNLNISHRGGHRATLLNDGRVLISGGHPQNTAEIYNPATNSFSLISNTMTTIRVRHQSVLLDDGKILLMGGEPGIPVVLSSAEIFDPVTESFTTISSMNEGRFDFGAVKLIDGRVMILGGAYDTGSGAVAIASVEIFDPNYEPPPCGLVAYYPFNGNANDESNNSNDGTVEGAALTADRFGKSNSAYYFDGTDDKIEIGDVGILDGKSKASISFWVKYSEAGLNTYDPMISKGPSVQWEGSYNIFRNNESDVISAGFIQDWDYGSGANTIQNYDDDIWHHIVVVLENKIVDIYVDGIVASTPSTTNCSSIQDVPDPLVFGYNFRSGNQYHWFKGILDDIRIYDCALTEEDILELYHENGWGESQQPIADAGENQTVDCDGTDGTEVTLDGTGSFDPDGDELTYSWTWDGGSAAGPTPTIVLPQGTTTITLVVNDGTVDSEPDEVDITVEDDTPPGIIISTEILTLWPANHMYQSIHLNDFDIEVIDGCDDNVGFDDLLITSVSSDEEENGNGDGNTVDDMVLVDCQEVKLRKERSGNGNGRVYSINVAVNDNAGNTATATCYVTVPHNKQADAIDDGVAYSIDGCQDNQLDVYNVRGERKKHMM